MQFTYANKPFWRAIRASNCVLWTVLCLLLALSVPCVSRAQSPPASPTQVKADLQRILAQPEFQPVHQSESLLTRITDWLQKKWDKFLNWLRHLFDMPEVKMGRGASTLSTILIYLIVPAFILAIVWLLARFIGDYLKTRGPGMSTKKSGAIFDIDQADADMVTEPDIWLQQARKFAEAGDYRRAFRAIFLGALLMMDRAGAIQYERSRTNGDYLRGLRSKGMTALIETFGPFVSEFDYRWYGDRPTGEADYQRGLQEYDRIQTLLHHGAPERA